MVSGERIGPYTIVEKLGEGGMGEVWRATDTTLGRQVAIKILPEAFAADPDRLARFEREAKTLASLNHPHIAAIYGFEKSSGTHALVMELVEGDDLSQRIARGAIPIDEALPIAKQIAEALEAAHEQGIIHRDLKPANIKVRPDGTVKVLDFGLAKAMDPTAASSPGMSMSPTITTPAMTQAGMILGTAAYMSPEQAKGRTVDKRSDVWAFGAVLYEMLAGRRAFEGEDVSDTLAHILMKEPDWTALPASVPPAVLTVMRRCLQKDRKQRVRDIGDVSLALEGAFETTAPQAATPALAAPLPAWRRALPVAAAVGVGVLLTVAAAGSLWPTAAPPVNRFSYRVPEGLAFRNAGRTVITVSPDGRQFVYNATGGLYLRGLGELEAHVIPGSEAGLSNPFFSPDAQSVAYWHDGQLKRLAVSGGASVVIGPAAENATGASWGPDGTILFGQRAGILRVPATGGTPAVVVPAQDGERLAAPHLLPDGDTVLFTVFNQAESRVVAQKMSTGERKVLVEGGYAARYLATGHLVYLVNNVLMGVAFDARRLAVTGGAVPVVQGVASPGQIGETDAHYGVAADGTLIYVYSAVRADGNSWQVAVSDRTGTITPLTLPAGAYETLRVSPDGTRIAVGVADPKETHVAIYNLDGRTLLRRLTFGGNNRYPVWSRDGQRVTYQSDRDGDRALFSQRADGTGPAERLTKPDKDTSHVPGSWSPRDETLLFTIVPSRDETGPGALWTYVRSSGTAAPFGGVTSAQQSPMFSPDGRWVAYAASGNQRSLELYVQPFPASGARYQLPTPSNANQLTFPIWSPDGTELFFVPGVGQLTVAAVVTRPTLTFGNPIAVPRSFSGNSAGARTAPRSFDIMPDGRFIGLYRPGTLAGAAGTASMQPEIHIVLNWFEELKRLVPTK